MNEAQKRFDAAMRELRSLGASLPYRRAVIDALDALSSLSAGRAEPEQKPGTPFDTMRERLKAFIRQHSAGGCRMLTERLECFCPLCDADNLAYAANQSAALQQQLAAAQQLVKDACDDDTAIREVLKGAGLSPQEVEHEETRGQFRRLLQALGLKAD